MEIRVAVAGPFVMVGMEVRVGTAVAVSSPFIVAVGDNTAGSIGGTPSLSSGATISAKTPMP